MVKETGLYLFHDYEEPLWPDVKKFCDEMIRKDILKPVTQVGRLLICCRGSKYLNDDR